MVAGGEGADHGRELGTRRKGHGCCAAPWRQSRLLHSWRRDARDTSLSEPVRFVPVVTKAVEEKSAVSMIEIELADVRIRVSGPVNARNLGAILAAVRASG